MSRLTAKESSPSMTSRAFRQARDAAKMARKLRRSVGETLRTSVHRVQTELDKALLNLHHSGASRFLDRMASQAGAAEPADLVTRVGRNVLRRAQEIRDGFVQAATAKRPSAEAEATAPATPEASVKRSKKPEAKKSAAGRSTRHATSHATSRARKPGAQPRAKSHSARTESESRRPHAHS